MSFLKDFIRYVPSRVVPALFSFLVLPVITRIFNPEIYGEYSLLLNSVSIFSIIATDWIALSITRFYPEYKKKNELSAFKDTLIKISGVSLGAVTIVAFVLSIVTRGFSLAIPVSLLDVGLLTLVSTSAANVLMHMFVAEQKPTPYSIFMVLLKCVCILLGILWVVLTNSGIRGFLWGQLAGTALILPFLYAISMKSLPGRAFSKPLTQDILKYGMPIVGINLASWVLTVSDRYVIEMFRGSYEVGLYSVSYNIANNSISSLIALIVLSSAPVVMNIWEHEGEEKARETLSQLTRYYLIIALPATVGFSILVKPLFSFFIAPEYFEGYRIVPWVAASMFIYGLQRNFQLGILFHKRSDIIMYIIFAAGVLNVVLNIFLVPRYGYVVAGITTFASYLLYGLVIVIVSRRYFKWKFPFVSLLKVILATAIMSGAILLLIHFVKMSAVLLICIAPIVGITVYFGVLYLLKEANKNLLKIAMGK